MKKKTWLFYSNEYLPKHVDVRNADGEAKFEIEEEIILIQNFGLKPKDLKLAEAIIYENHELLILRWDEYFNKK